MADVEKFIAKLNPRYSESIWENVLTYDSTTETLEPIYYWILDFTRNFGWKIVKLSDNFTAAPGSSYFADLSGRATRMQEEGMKILGAVNVVIKSIINILYDLKEFEIRLEAYKDAKEGKTKEDRQAGLLALKDIWMSTVDMKRGRGSINQMTYELGFSTLRDAFMKADKVEDVNAMLQSGILNERVARVLKPRVAEFLEWKDRSYDELGRRFRIEQAYLKSQIGTLKLYSSWVKPYLQAAEQLRMKEQPGIGVGPPELISAFGTMTLSLSLMLTSPVKVSEKSGRNQEFPESFKRAKIRPMNSVAFIDFNFRSYPTQQFPHAGRVDIRFSAYALNQDELDLLNDKIKSDQTNSLLGIAGDLSDESLKQIQDEIDYFEKKPEKKEKKEESVFSGIFSDFMKTLAPKSKKEIEDEKKKLEEEDKEKQKEHLKMLKEFGVPADTFEEKLVRDYAEMESASLCFNAYDKFKKSRGMAAPPSPFDEPDVYQRFRARRAEIAAALAKSRAK